VVVWTTSDSDRDIGSCYALGARCYLTKPIELASFQAALRAVERFWLSVVRLSSARVG
jgi:DNA-binding NarL/FixJ family response regulator